MSERLEMECKRCGDNEDRIDGFCSNECKDKYSLEAALSKMSIRIAELEAAQRWRVVADGELPEHDGEYWVWLEAWNIQDKGEACIYSKDYHDNNGFFNLIPVTHWMPLPELPEVQE